MKALWRYFNPKNIRRNLPRLHQSLMADVDPATLTADEYLILLAGLVKDDDEARKLMAKYKVTSAPELLRVLPPPKVDRWRKLRRWIQALEGSEATNPHAHDWLVSRNFYSSK